MRQPGRAPSLRPSPMDGESNDLRSMRARIGLAWMLAGGLLLGGCPGNENLDSLELSGYVSVLQEGAGAGAPIPNARVVFVSDTLVRAETTTDGNGRYQMIVLTDVPFGQVRASAAGFADAELTVMFDTPQRRIDLELRPAP